MALNCPNKKYLPKVKISTTEVRSQVMSGVCEVTIERRMCKIGKWPKYHMIPSNNNVTKLRSSCICFVWCAHLWSPNFIRRVYIVSAIGICILAIVIEIGKFSAQLLIIHLNTFRTVKIMKEKCYEFRNLSVASVRWTLVRMVRKQNCLWLSIRCWFCSSCQLLLKYIITKWFVLCVCECLPVRSML